MTVKRFRAGSWNVFERRFRPIIRKDDSLLWDRSELPVAWSSPRVAGHIHEISIAVHPRSSRLNLIETRIEQHFGLNKSKY